MELFLILGGLLVVAYFIFGRKNKPMSKDDWIEVLGHCQLMFWHLIKRACKTALFCVALCLSLASVLAPTIVSAETKYIGSENPSSSYQIYSVPRNQRRFAIGYLEAGREIDVIKVSRNWSQFHVDMLNRDVWIETRFLRTTPLVEAEQEVVIANQSAATGDLAQQPPANLVPEGTCEIVVSTHLSKSDAVAAARRANYVPWQNPSIFETNTGRYKFSLGNIRNGEIRAVLRELILGGDAPEAECVSGRDFVRKYDAQGNLAIGGAEELAQCYFVVGSRKTTFEAAQLIDELSTIDASTFDIFLAQNGWYAITLGLIEEAQFETKKSSMDVPSDSFCTTGASFTRVPHVCARQPVNCSEGYTVRYNSCEAQNAIGSLGIEFDSAFCKMPKSFARETLLVDGFIGLEEDGQIYSFAAETSSEEFVVKISHAERNVQFFWQEYVPQTNRGSVKSSNNRPGFFATWFNNMFSYSGGSSSSSLLYGCEFTCEGAGFSPKSATIRVNTPHSDYGAAQNYVRDQYEEFCSANYAFHGSTGTGADVSFPNCEISYYEN